MGCVIHNNTKRAKTININLYFYVKYFGLSTIHLNKLINKSVKYVFIHKEKDWNDVIAIFKQRQQLYTYVAVWTLSDQQGTRIS